MLIRVIVFSLVTTLSALPAAYAGKIKLMSEMLDAGAFSMFSQSEESISASMQSCETDETAVVTIYATTGYAQVGIDVKLDGNPVGSLLTHFPDIGPACKTPGSEGVITIVIPAGKHTLEAESLNLLWPGHAFTIKKCECLLLPLS